MLVEVLSGIKLLNMTREVYVYGEISSVDIEDRENYKDLKSSYGYKKLKEFYQSLVFILEDDTRFYKSLPVMMISDWQKMVELEMNVKDLKMEIAFKDIIIENYEKSRELIDSRLLGRYILKRIESKRS